MISYHFDTEGKPLKEIAHKKICKQAAFRLDHELNITPQDEFVLDEGRWFLIENGERRALEGRWVTPKVKLLPEKKQGARVRSVVVNVKR
jgi:hypothetical protein